MIQFSHSTSSLTDRKTEVFSAPEGTYNLVVVANPVGNIRTSGSISAVITAESVEAVQSGYNNGIFGMVSEMKDPDITKLGSSVTIDSSSTHGEPAKGTAKLDRLAVKIYDKTETPTIDPEVTAAVGDLTINGFLLVNSKKTFNLFQEWTNSEAGNVVGKYINSPKEDDVKDVFLPFSSYTEVTEDAGGNITSITKKDGAVIWDKAPVYVLENRPAFNQLSTLTSGMGVTTGVVYEVTANEGVTFYTIGDAVYKKFEDVKKLPAFKDDTTITADNLGNLRAKGIKVYEGGKMYYSYFIQDKNNQLAYKGEAAAPHNGVYRNSSYALTINKITNIGDDVPGGGKVTPSKPNPPIKPDEMYLEVTVEINDWYLNEIGIDF